MLGVKHHDVLGFDVFQPIDDGALEFLDVFFGDGGSVVIKRFGKGDGGQYNAQRAQKPVGRRFGALANREPDIGGADVHGGHLQPSRNRRFMRSWQASNLGTLAPVKSARAATQIIASCRISCQSCQVGRACGLVFAQHQKQLGLGYSACNSRKVSTV